MTPPSTRAIERAIARVILACAIVFSAAVAACGGGSPSQPSPNPDPPQPAAPALTAPVPDNPDHDEQLTTLQPDLRAGNATSNQAGAKTYQFQVSSTIDFTIIDADGQNVAEGPNSTSWIVTPALQPNTIYWWRVRAQQGSTVGPWSAVSRFKSRIQGYNLAGELFDPLTNEATVGSPIGVTFLPNRGVRLNALTSRVRYALLQTLSQGEFSLQATGLDNDSDGEVTKLFSMQEGSDDIATNPYRATIDKRANGTVSFRLIAGNPDTRADADRRIVQFDPTKTYLWKFTWGGGTARLVIRENNTQGAVIFDNAKSYGGTYSPNPHIAYLGAPVPRGGAVDASVPGAIIRNVWISSRPRPEGLGALDAQ
jgi:hypothetical protein